MVETLGLEEDMTEAIRNIVGGLSPSVVAGIRQATLDMLDRADAVANPEYKMPLECEVSKQNLDSGAPVKVAVEDLKGVQTIYVRPSNA
jgi:hypothetical protein